MKKKSGLLNCIIIAGLLFNMQGCAELKDFSYDKEENMNISRISDEPQSEGEELDESVADDCKTENPIEADNDIFEQMPKIYYAYHNLEEDEKKLYLEIYDILTNIDDNVYISTTDKQIIDPVFNCVLNDHPELFYVEGYEYTEYKTAGYTTRIAFSGRYNMSVEEIEQNQMLIDQRVNEYLANIPETTDEYYKVKYIYEYLIYNTEYDSEAENNQNICSVFIEGRSVCQGYAKAFQYLLNKLDIQSYLVTGFVNSGRHAWNLVRVNNEYYYIDPTWGDASYSVREDESESSDGFCPDINYDYFLVSTEELMKTHSLEKVVQLPECNSITDNYFVREGLYITEYNEQQLLNIFDSEAVRAADYVTIKCCDSYTFDIVRSKLIDEQRVFSLISNRGRSIAYANNSTQRTISFWNIFI